MVDPKTNLLELVAKWDPLLLEQNLQTDEQLQMYPCAGQYLNHSTQVVLQQFICIYVYTFVGVYIYVPVLRSKGLLPEYWMVYISYYHG